LGARKVRGRKLPSIVWERRKMRGKEVRAYTSMDSPNKCKENKYNYSIYLIINFLPSQK